MSLVQPQEMIMGYLQLTGAFWDQPPRDSLEERIAALREFGCVGMGMNIDELERVEAATSRDHLRGMFAGYGVGLVEFEMLAGWEEADDYQGPLREREVRTFALAEAYGVPKVKAFAMAIPGITLAPVEVLAKRFAALCDRAADHGVDIALECLSFMPGFSHAKMVDVVTLADRPNATVQVDMWHLMRDPTGVPSLDRLTGKQIAGVELCDGPAQPPADLMKEAVDGRLLPGDGEWDIAGVLRTLDAKGVDVPISVEILSEELRTLTPRENVARTVTAVRDYLERIRTS
ncbi:sugar phosphate isomerase/epimerase family protein [Labedaea rhizosphaerae]|uniref:Sugar phosphate isomerase/epimerase n=1 Tax=Labedaea rhizosphaerae TaxID=598644 RepID=A0A4R6SFU6_LABRH|nr:sugar phosphate isomerase/epimerase [Labedaea rhizosphaerae]TDP97986.1 sugar phosphate isomerase/epimerase [Labedaea rhizosphaerae]